MRIGVTIGLGARRETTVPGLVESAQALEVAGFHSVWIPNAFAFDAITAMTAVGVQTSRIEVGTAVVPTFPRHPLVMAQQAITAAQASGNRFTLGIGLSHKVMMDDALGIPFEHPAEHMREYLSILAPLLRGEPVSFRGDCYRTDAALSIHAEQPIPLLVAAMGPAMLRLAGQHTDGTITSWVGPKTLAEHIVPTIERAAAEAGRPAPRIAVGLPVILTADVPGTRERLAPQVAFYDELPSYRAMFEREGASGPADVALVGDEAELREQLNCLRDAGATDFLAQPIAAEGAPAARTIEFLAHCAG